MDPCPPSCIKATSLDTDPFTLHSLTSPDALSMVRDLVQRAAPLHLRGIPALVVTNPDILHGILRLATYTPPPVVLPGVSPLPLAVMSSYWMAWRVLLLICACNGSSLAAEGWERLPTLRCLLHMTLVNDYTQHGQRPGDAGHVSRQTAVDLDDESEDRLRAFEQGEVLRYEVALARALGQPVPTPQTSEIMARVLFMTHEAAPRRIPQV